MTKEKKIFSTEASKILDVSSSGIKYLTQKGILIPAGFVTFRSYGKDINANYFTQEEIDKCLKNDDFKEYQKKHHKRQKSAEKAVKTKTEKTLQLIRDTKITVEKMSLKRINEESLESKRAWYRETGQWDMDVFSAPKCTKVRWRDNFIIRGVKPHPLGWGYKPHNC